MFQMSKSTFDELWCSDSSGGASYALFKESRGYKRAWRKLSVSTSFAKYTNFNTAEKNLIPTQKRLVKNFFCAISR